MSLDLKDVFIFYEPFSLMISCGSRLWLVDNFTIVFIETNAQEVKDETKISLKEDLIAYHPIVWFMV